MKKFLLVLLLIVVLAVVFHGVVLSALGGYLVRSEAPEKADIAVVPAGDFEGNRILKAGELVRSEYAPLALISGPSENYGYYECDLAIPFAEKAGFPGRYFLPFPNHARSTREEAQVILPELRRRNIRTVLLVTSNYHTRRASRIYRALAPDLRFIVIASPDPDFKPGTWWHTREGRKTFAIEWMKTVAEWFGL